MKKLTLALAVTAALTAGAANAYTVAQQGNGLLVPHVVHNGPTDTTAVGLISRTAGTVYWTFFDVDSNHVADGQFNVTDNDMYSFIWANEAGTGLQGVDGYLVFSLDTDGNQQINAADAASLAGNAFQVNTSTNDVAYIPTLGLVANDYRDGTNLTTMDRNSIRSITNSNVNAGDIIDMRYFIDGAAGGTDTAILIWTADNAQGPYTVNMYNDNQDRRSVNLDLENQELNVFNPENIVGRPASFTDGFIQWSVPNTIGLRDADNDPATPPLGGVFAYSVVNSPAFGAAQTLLATHN